MAWVSCPFFLFKSLVCISAGSWAAGVRCALCAGLLRCDRLGQWRCVLQTLMAPTQLLADVSELLLPEGVAGVPHLGLLSLGLSFAPWLQFILLFGNLTDVSLSRVADSMAFDPDVIQSHPFILRDSA